jgi:hypothetical protein
MVNLELDQYKKTKNKLKKVQGKGRSIIFSEREAVDGHDDVHGLVFPADGAAAVGAVVPEAGTRRVQASPVFLHHRARH